VPKKDKRYIQRQSFIEIAQQMDFDPLDWDKWKTVQPTQLKVSNHSFLNIAVSSYHCFLLGGIGES